MIDKSTGISGASFCSEKVCMNLHEMLVKLKISLQADGVQIEGSRRFCSLTQVFKVRFYSETYFFGCVTNFGGLPMH